MKKVSAKAIEKTLDTWLAARIDEDNVFKATRAIIAAVPQVQRCPWSIEQGYAESGGWYYRDESNLGELILKVENTGVRRALAKKFFILVERMYEVVKDGFILSRSGHLELLLAVAEKEISRRKPDDFAYKKLWDLWPVLLPYLNGRCMLQFFDDALGLESRVEKLIEIVLARADDPKEWEVNSHELGFAVEIYMLHKKKIPQKLLPIAARMLEHDREELKEERRDYEGRVAKLKGHIAALKKHIEK